MKPIISPKLFYLIQVVDNLSTISIILMLILLVAVVVCIALLIFAIKEDMFYERKEEKKESPVYKKILKKLIIPFVIFLLFSTLLPGKSTMYKMVVADNITPHNIEIVGEGAKDVVDYIVESVDKLMEGEEEEND